MKTEPWSDLKGLPDISSTVNALHRHEFMTAHGWAEPLFCASCGRMVGFVATGTVASQLCGSCLVTHGGLPLPEVPNVVLTCTGCGVARSSIPRELLGKVVYYCQPCEVRMGEHPPLPMLSMEEERALGVRRSA